LNTVSPAGQRSAPLARPRLTILITLLVLAAAGWIVVVALSHREDSMTMDERSMAVPDLTMGSASLFLVMWTAMMVAMMFPAAAPMIGMYARTQRSRRTGATALFVGSYLTLWIAFGALALVVATLIERWADASPWVADNWGRLGGGLIVMAGLYQLSPLKDVCLSRCRSPMSFILSAWREGRRGAVIMGLHHGVVCLGCCWMLFLILVPIGVMNIGAMLILTAVVFWEKALPGGRSAKGVIAAVLVVYGVAVIANPELLPTVA
jgi:predicted metal-binding membrane protein